MMALSRLSIDRALWTPSELATIRPISLATPQQSVRSLVSAVAAAAGTYLALLFSGVVEPPWSWAGEGARDPGAVVLHVGHALPAAQPLRPAVALRRENGRRRARRSSPDPARSQRLQSPSAPAARLPEAPPAPHPSVAAPPPPSRDPSPATATPTTAITPAPSTPAPSTSTTLQPPTPIAALPPLPVAPPTLPSTPSQLPTPPPVTLPDLTGGSSLP